MTFIGFNINKFDRNLVDQQTGLTLENNIMTRGLWVALQRNNVPLQENFDDLTRYNIFECYKILSEWHFLRIFLLDMNIL